MSDKRRNQSNVYSFTSSTARPKRLLFPSINAKNHALSPANGGATWQHVSLIIIVFLLLSSLGVFLAGLAHFTGKITFLSVGYSVFFAVLSGFFVYCLYQRIRG